jgi:perosamine synthetase
MLIINNSFSDIVSTIREAFNVKDAFIPLHEPKFIGNEKKYLNDAIDSTFVSSVGKYVDKFEEMMKEITGAKYAIATVNGTAGLHIALILAGVERGDEVITQPLTFVATSNAISYCGAIPVFIDVDIDSLGMSPDSLLAFLKSSVVLKDGVTYNKITGKKISACVPMHTFGQPCRIDEIVDICYKYNIPLIEDSAESLGSIYKNKKTGTFGKLGVFSFNGNKTVTCGGGGAVVTDDEEIAKKAKHITTTAKISHRWEYEHDMVGYNYRLPNLNAALACAQLEQLETFLLNKRQLSFFYMDRFKQLGIPYISEISEAKSNYWLMAIKFEDQIQKNEFLKFSNDNLVMTRPIWRLMNKLVMNKDFFSTSLVNSEILESTIVNIPSSVRL